MNHYDPSIRANLDDNWDMPKREKGSRYARPKHITVTPVRMVAVVIDRSYHLLTEGEANDLRLALDDNIGGNR